MKTARSRYDRITATIEREWLAQIIAGTKKIEYRQIKPYWTKRFAKVSIPFELRLLNGMNPPVPEVTVLIHKITRRGREYRLHIKKVLGFKHWDKRRKPKSDGLTIYFRGFTDTDTTSLPPGRAY